MIVSKEKTHTHKHTQLHKNKKTKSNCVPIRTMIHIAS